MNYIGSIGTAAYGGCYDAKRQYRLRLCRIWTRSVQEAADKRSAFKHLERVKWKASRFTLSRV